MVVTVVHLIDRRLRIVRHHMNHAAHDVALADDRISSRRELVVPRLDRRIRSRALQVDLILDPLAVYRLARICRSIGILRNAVRREELRSCSVDCDRHLVLSHHRTRLFIRDEIGLRPAGDSPCRNIHRAIVRLGNIRCRHLDLLRRDQRLSIVRRLRACALQANLRAIAEGSGKSGVVVVDIRIVFVFHKLFDGLQALERVDHVLVRRDAVTVLDVLVVIVRAELFEIRIILAVHRVIERDLLSGAKAEYEIELALEVGCIARAVRLPLAHLQAADLGVRRAVVGLAEGRPSPDSAHVVCRDGKRRDLSGAEDFLLLDEIVLRCIVSGLQIIEGRLQISVLHVAVDDAAVRIAVYMRILREGAVFIFRAVIGANGVVVVRRIKGRVVKLDIIAVRLADEVEMSLHRRVLDNSIAVVDLVCVRRRYGGKLLAPDVTHTDYAVLLAGTRIQLGDVGSAAIDKRIVLIRVGNRPIAFEAHGVGDLLVAGSIAAREAAVRIGCVAWIAILVVSVDVRHVEHSAVAFNEAMLCQKFAVIIARGLFQDERLCHIGKAVGMFRAVRLVGAFLHGVRAVVDLLHRVDRQEDITLFDLAQSLVCQEILIVVTRIMARRRAVGSRFRRDAGQIREVEVLVIKRELEGHVLLAGCVLAAARSSCRILVVRAVNLLHYCNRLHLSVIGICILHIDGVHKSSGVARDLRRAVIDLGDRRSGEFDLEVGIAANQALRDPAAAMEAVIATCIRREIVTVIGKCIVARTAAQKADIAVIDTLLVDIFIEVRARISRLNADAGGRSRKSEQCAQILDRPRAVILLVGIGCVEHEGGLVDDVRIRRERRDLDRRAVRIVDDIVVPEVMVICISAADGERVVHLLVRSSIGILIGRRGVVGAVSRDHARCRRFRCITASAEGDVGVAVRRHFAIDLHIRRPVVLLPYVLVDPGIDLALFDVAPRRQRLRVRSGIVEGIVGRIRTPERRRVGDHAAVLGSGTGIDVRIRIVINGGLAISETIAVEITRDLEVFLVRIRRAIVDLAQIRRLVERRRQKLLRDVARRVAVVRLVREHVIALRIRRIDRVVELEVLQHLVLELDVEEDVLARRRILRAAAGSGLILRLRHLVDIVVEVDQP